jgi:hypothetical protein
MKPGVLLCPSHMGSVRFAGMHGYHPSEPTADAVLLASTAVDRSVDHITHVLDVLLDDQGLGRAEPAAGAPIAGADGRAPAGVPALEPAARGGEDGGRERAGAGAGRPAPGRAA